MFLLFSLSLEATGAVSAQQQPSPTTIIVITPILTTPLPPTAIPTPGPTFTPIPTSPPTPTPIPTLTPTPTLPLVSPTPHIIAKNLVEIPFKKLGYGDKVLRGPLAITRYYFGIPANWKLQSGNHLLLDIEYNVSGKEGQAPALLQVMLNDKVMHTKDLDSPGFYQIRVDLPQEQFYLYDSTNINTLRISLKVSADCEEAQLSSLVLRDSSTLRFSRLEKSLPIDLALYPEPLYQPGSFEPNRIRFILPEAPTQADVESAAMIAGRLGRLTNSSLQISATLASETPTPGGGWDENLIMIGLPDDIPLLSELDLALPLTRRQLGLSSEMPASVEPGKVFSYTLFVTNTEKRSQSLFVEDQLPRHTVFLSCSNECTPSQASLLRWPIGQLDAGATTSNTLTLALDEQALLGQPIEHTATLFDANDTPLNADTLAASVALTASRQTIRSNENKSDYFFLQAGRAVAETDGVLQELVSPWNPQRAILVVSGLDQEALYKATQALSSRNRFPDMNGPFARVRQVLKPDKAENDAEKGAENLSFDSMGYTNSVLKGTRYELLEYAFDLPWGFSLTDEAFVALHISHGGRLANKGAALDVELNGVPISSVLLVSEETGDYWVSVPIPSNPLQTGPNRLSLRLAYEVDWCIDERNLRAWLTVYSDSFFHIPRQDQALPLSLSAFPYPFANQAGLEDLVFALPQQPTLTEVQGALRLTAVLGRAAGGDDFVPRVTLGGDPSSEQWPGHHLIVLGQPTSNLYLSAINPDLPQPFYPGSNEFLQTVNQAIYWLEPGTELGFVQELLAPWDADQVILVVTGTSDAGVGWAIRALTDNDLVWRLYGNLALVREEKIQATDTRKQAQGITNQLVATLFPDVAPQPTPTLTPTPTPTPTASATPTVQVPAVVPSTSTAPFWLLPLFISSIVAATVMVGIILWRSRV